ncbi:heterokaryon incompatibility protein [Niveomyces insectorum RCEF 264]|uniref:Heterokaryon incompatibility protein n=1 Tax=Niveomyces insectorum RCEF 264 TaxID=1081102 RepID=A0A167N8W5_9HYPO|nr:heterokaryon incompatibility protein [Niveomyces insectorum RCEF 264]
MCICSAKRQDLVHVSPYCPERPYLELTIPDNARSVCSARFVITSHDQGISGTGRDVPPYEHSYTWFTIYVVHADRRKDPRQTKLQSNYRAEATFRTHDIFWDQGHPDETARAWLASLQAGDTIQLFARAFYPAWVNFVKEAKIVVEYESAPEQDTTRPAPVMDAGSNPLATSLYRALDPARREIRLLEVFPGAYDDAVRCALVHTSLADNQAAASFEVLSYCWGDAKERGLLELVYPGGAGGPPTFQFNVSRTVEMALRRLRYGDGRKRRLWVDAVCINQSDTDERREQVEIMVDVYARASQANVWLGESDPVSSMAMGILRDIYNAEHRVCPAGPGVDEAARCTCTGTRHYVTRDTLATLDSNLYQRMHQIYDLHVAALVADAGGPQTESLYHAITTVFARPWFRRVWVLQEALAGENTVVHCGNESMPWQELVAVNGYLSSQHNFLAPLHSAPQALMPAMWATLIGGKQRAKRANAETQNRVDATRDKPTGTSTITNADDQSPGAPSLLDVFLAGLDLEASDPRDKLFALLSFGRETGHRMQNLPLAVQPNYTKAPEHVFADLTRWLIAEKGSLDVLSAAVHSQPGRTWQDLHCSIALHEPATRRPTWALGPDGKNHWVQATLQAQFRGRFCAGGDGTSVDSTLLSVPEVTSKKAPTPKETNETKVDDSDHLALCLRGFTVASVAQVTPFPLGQVIARCGSDTEKNGNKDVESDWQDLSEAFTAIFDPSCTVKTWISARNDDAAERQDGKGTSQNVAKTNPAQFNDHMRAHWGYGEKPTHQTADLAQQQGNRFGLVDDMTAPPCSGRCFFVASNGSVGLCPNRTREGDVVAVLSGGQVPFLLRPASTPRSGDDVVATKPVYELVGECFLRGIMHGEFVARQAGLGAVPEVFTLV